MKFLPVVLAAVVLSGCSGMANRSHGSWLEQVGKPSQAALPLSDQQVSELTAEAARLRAQAETMRLKLASEKDRVRRMSQLRDLAAVGDQLRPIEQTLRDGGHALPAQAAAVLQRPLS